jgi:xanthine dehydrogenase large subunit
MTMKGTIPHESAELHVSGEAVYVDDIPLTTRALVGRVVYSPHARARIKTFDISNARRMPAVHAVLSWKEIPGQNQMGPVVKDEPCLAHDEVTFIGQAVFLIAAESDDVCREAEKKIRIEYEPLEAILEVETAMARNNLLGPERSIVRGEPDDALRRAAHVIKGELRTGAQEHWYLESQVCLCVPGERSEMHVYSATQHPSETQALVAEVLGISKNQVTVEVRRIGGGFGGKETQANHAACWAALLSHATRRPVKIRLSRDDDMIMTGKRHRFLTRYEVGFGDDGVLQAVRFELNSDGGATTDLSFAILERAMLHVDNAYFVPNLSVRGRVWKTNLPPNTAMRGFGGPQAMAAMETVIDRIARFLHRDSAEIRNINFYGTAARNVTHYGETVENNRLDVIFRQLMDSSDYQWRRKAVNEFNAAHEFTKRGLAITPVKFGISFTTSFLNQASALVNLYKDGSVLVSHSGIEMGQGLHTKIIHIAAREFGLSPDRVRIDSTNTSKLPNTSATAASSGADLNGMAVRNAIEILKLRIAEALAGFWTEKHPDLPTNKENVRFEKGTIFDSASPEHCMSFAEAMPLLHQRRISLSASGFYSTPGIGWDRQTGKGTPFRYYAFGMAVTEVEIDVLTGCHSILRTDILHDVGDSVNAGVDMGQIEGGYVQGVGWCTTEEIKWDDKGNLLTHSPDTYKIPTVSDIPPDFRVSILEGVPNPYAVHRSKAVGEPPFMLALSAWLAIKDAISAVGNHELEPEFSLPATNEVILLSIERVKESMAQKASRVTLAQN